MWGRVWSTGRGTSPSVKFRPGDVKNKLYLIESPPGHFATVGFDADLVRENGNSVPLTDVYLHHWIMFKFAAPVGHAVPVGKKLEDMMSVHPADGYHGGAGAGAIGDG
ncbi:hypothetical protein M758_7G083000 [Ceratodon purpureus]|nr:hypothetical protein M758_7G083000 [Ceratodon purpureus]